MVARPNRRTTALPGPSPTAGAGERIGGRGAGLWLGWTVCWLLCGPWPAWAQEVQKKKPLIESLDDQTRVKVLAALAGLIILGLAMLLLVWLGARITWRYRDSAARYEPPRRTTLDLDDWARKPLVEPQDGGDEDRGEVDRSDSDRGDDDRGDGGGDGGQRPE